MICFAQMDDFVSSQSSPHFSSTSHSLQGRNLFVTENLEREWELIPKIKRWVDGRREVWMDGWMDGWMYGWMDCRWRSSHSWKMKCPVSIWKNFKIHSSFTRNPKSKASRSVLDSNTMMNSFFYQLFRKEERNGELIYTWRKKLREMYIRKREDLFLRLDLAVTRSHGGETPHKWICRGGSSGWLRWRYSIFQFLS